MLGGAWSPECAHSQWPLSGFFRAWDPVPSHSWAAHLRDCLVWKWKANGGRCSCEVREVWKVLCVLSNAEHISGAGETYCLCYSAFVNSTLGSFL